MNYEKNIQKFLGKTFTQVVEDFEAEMVALRKELGMSSNEPFVLEKEKKRAQI